MRKGSNIKAAHDITWKVVLGMAAPPMIVDSVLVPAKTKGEIIEYSKDSEAYLVEFEGGHEWWLKKEDLTS